ncbi:hypothetical protein KY019_002686 [Vibrio cholerae]|nr:hypothetical protein [Vibrio cholerae]EHU0384305.1 hypothetical protein [Vibrio cholerae]EJL6669260.1 hypothetical protein [Vibrio cholerae]EKF9153880.1 hypothetical protein [Vibrio cholerae]
MTKDISRYNMRWVEGDTLPEALKPKLSPKERYLKQLQENHRQSEETWAYVQANEDRYALQRADALTRRNASQMLDDSLRDSLSSQCSLEEEMAKNHQHVLIADLEDAHKILHNIWLESGRDVAAIAASINTSKSWFNHTEPMFNAHSIAKQFGDMGIKADLVESKGKTLVAFSGTDKNGKVLKHAFVNGTRINMNGKKYPLNSFKSIQAGFSPKSKSANFKGAAALTFVVSASIATTDLVFKDDYHLVNWFGNVGSDMFKALVQFGAGEAALFAAAFYGASILSGAVIVVLAYVLIEVVWEEYKISDKVVGGINSALE